MKTDEQKLNIVGAAAQLLLENGSETYRSNIGWSASANVSWISAVTNSATVSENPTTSDRSGTITLTQNESGRKLSITVYQDRKVSVDIN